jgi:hypothetical protein
LVWAIPIDSLYAYLYLVNPPPRMKNARRRIYQESPLKTMIRTPRRAALRRAETSAIFAL